MFALLTLLLSTGLGLVLVEVACGFAFVDRLGEGSRALQLLGWRAEPNAEVEGVRINAEGFTGAVLSRARSDPDEIRVLALGGSVMFYHDMTEEIRQALQSRTARKVSVVGAALPTHTSRSSCIKFDRYFRRFDFDFVLIYHAINDLWSNHHPPEVYRPDYSHLNPWYRRGWLLDRSIAARVYYNRKIWKRTRLPGMGFRNNLSDFAGCAVFAENLNFLVTEARREGATPILMTFAAHIPEHYSRTAFTDGELGYATTKEHEVSGVHVWGTDRFVIEGLRRHNEIIRELAEEQHVPLIDQQALGAAIANFVDPCHFSRAGQRRFIENILRLFEAREFFKRSTEAMP